MEDILTAPKVPDAEDHSSLHKIEISPRKSGRKRKKIVNEMSTENDDQPILDADFVPTVNDEEEKEENILAEEKPKKRGE